MINLRYYKHISMRNQLALVALQSYVRQQSYSGFCWGLLNIDVLYIGALTWHMQVL